MSGGRWLRRTGGWGVLDDCGLRYTWHTTEEVARRDYDADATNVILVSRIDTDDEAGTETYKVERVKPARCVVCERITEARHEGGEYRLPDGWEPSDAVDPYAWPSDVTPAVCGDCEAPPVRGARRAYSDKLPGDVQVDLEEWIAAQIFDMTDDSIDEEDCQGLGRRILYEVIKRVAPGLLEKETR